MKEFFNNTKLTIAYLIEQDDLLWEKIKDQVHLLYISFLFLFNTIFISCNLSSLNIFFGYFINLILFINIFFYLFFIYKFYKNQINPKENLFLSILIIFCISSLNYIYIIFLSSNSIYKNNNIFTQLFNDLSSLMNNEYNSYILIFSFLFIILNAYFFLKSWFSYIYDLLIDYFQQNYNLIYFIFYIFTFCFVIFFINIYINYIHIII